MKTQIKLAAALLLLSILGSQLLTASAQDTVFTYQGRVTDNGTNFTSTGLFEFALVTSTNANQTATATVAANEPSGGYITAYTVTFGGSGYVTAPAVTVSGGGGSGATAIAHISGSGTVTNLSVSNTGNGGYTSMPTVTIAPPPADISYTTYWSNDGTSVNGSEPAAAVSAAVTNGLFTMVLGDTTLPGMAALPAALFAQPGLRLRIWFNDGANGFAALNPAQNLTPAPYAIQALKATTASNVSGTVSAAQISGTISSSTLPASPGFTGTVTANNFAGNGTGVTNVNAAALNGMTAANFWQLAGNKVAAGQFLGSTNNQPVELHVNGLRALRLEPTANDANHSNMVNVVGGSPVNFITPGVYGSVIAGGGAVDYYGAVYTNSVSADLSFLGGGYNNSIQSSAHHSFLGGGLDNSIQPSAWYSFLGGGYGNIASGVGSFVGGGGADEQDNVLPNVASGGASVVVGGVANHATFDHSTVGGGQANIASGSDQGATTVGGGFENQATFDGSTVGGGFHNVASGTSGGMATVAGGYKNHATGDNSAVGGGDGNVASGTGSFIGGGGYDGNNASGNQVTGGGSAIGGGVGNAVASLDSVIGGGQVNTIQTGSDNSTIAGGINNTINTGSGYAFIGGGKANTASGSYSFAAGQQAQAVNQGAFVWADSQNAAFASTANDSFNIRAQGGVFLDNSTPAINFGGATKQMLNLYGNGFGIGVQSDTEYFRSVSGYAWFRGGSHNDNQNNPGGGTVLMTLDNSGNLECKGTISGNIALTSDRNLKENFMALDAQSVLAKVAALSVEQWNYKTEGQAVRHVGPMAQDFHAAFGLDGADDKHIFVVDEGGVALAAIQGLDQKVNEKDAKIQEQGAEIAALKQSVAELKALVEKLANK